MSRTREIPREEWKPYFESLNRHEHPHRVRLEVESSSLGEQPLAESVPLRFIDLEPRGSAAGAIEVTVGREGEAFTHLVEDTRRVYVEEDDQGEPECIDLESDEQGKTLIFFEPSGAAV